MSLQLLKILVVNRNNNQLDIRNPCLILEGKEYDDYTINSVLDLSANILSIRIYTFDILLFGDR